MVNRAGIKIEAVGEQPMGDSTGGQIATAWFGKTLKVEDTHFWDCIIVQYDRDQLIGWGFDPEKQIPIVMEAFENQQSS